MKKTFRPGQIVPKSGQAELHGPRGGHTNREVTVVKGEPFPPAPKRGMTYTLTDVTRHKSKK